MVKLVSWSMFVCSSQVVETRTRLATFAFVAIALLSGAPLALADCANIAGHWNGPEGGKLNITQKSCRFEHHDANHTISGTMHNDEYGDYTVQRTSDVSWTGAKIMKMVPGIPVPQPDTCTVTFYGRINAVTGNSFETHVYRTSGLCDLPEGWTQDQTWVRAQ